MATTTPLQAIANVREDRIHATTTNYPNSVGIKHYNRSRNKVLAKMRLLDDEYFYEEIKTDSVIGQREYTLSDVWSEAITRVKRVYVKYSATDTYYTPVREVNPAQLTYGKDYYLEWSKTDPFYYIQDNSVWIFPVATETVTEGILFDVIVNPQTLITTDTADKVQVPERIQELIEDGMIPFALEYIGKGINDTVAHENIADKRLRESVADLSERWPNFIQQGNPVQYNAR